MELDVLDRTILFHGLVRPALRTWRERADPEYLQVVDRSGLGDELADVPRPDRVMRVGKSLTVVGRDLADFVTATRPEYVAGMNAAATLGWLRRWWPHVPLFYALDVRVAAILLGIDVPPPPDRALDRVEEAMRLAAMMRALTRTRERG